MRKFLLLSTFLLYLIIGAYSSASAAEVTDVLTNAGLINSSTSSYTKFSGKTFKSTAEYAGVISGNNNTIQMNKATKSYIVNTKSGGTLKKIKVVWSSGCTTKSIAVYAQYTPYTATMSSTSGQSLGSISASSAIKDNDTNERYTVFTFPEGTAYTYLGLFGGGGVTNSDRIEVTWDVSETPSGPADYDPAYQGLVKESDGSYSLPLNVDETFELTPTTANGPVITYSSSDATVAKYDSGSILANKEGTATITGSWDAVADTWNAGTVTINVTVTKADTRQNVTMNWSASTANASLGAAFTSPTLNISPEEAASAVEYTSSVPTVASISADGTVSINSAGQTVITASIPEDNETYKSATASYTLTVSDPNSKYHLVKSLSEFDAAQKCILVAYKSGSYSAVMAGQNDSKKRDKVDINISGSTLPDKLEIPNGAVPFTLEKPSANATTYKINVGNDKYLKLQDNGTNITEVTQTYATEVTISVNDNDSRVRLGKSNDRALGYNSSSSVFGHYSTDTSNGSDYTQVYLYQQRVEIAKEDALIDWDGIETGAEVVRELVGDVTFPTLSVLPEEAASAVRYSSSDEAVATIDAVTGEITRKGVGTTTITAKIEGDVKYNNVSDNYVLKIKDSRQVVTVTFNPASAEACIINADEFAWPVATAYIGEVASEDAKSAVVFSSSNEEVLRIGSDYTDHNLLASGEADIIATIPVDNLTYRMEAPAKCHIKVVRGEVTLAFDAATATADMFVNFTEPTLSVTPNVETVKSNITYTSSDKSVADVNATTGEVTTYKAGETVIKATFAGSALYNPAEASYTLTVRDARVSPTLTWSCGESMEYAMGSEIAFESPTITVTGEGIDADAVKALLTYESSNENVATVDTEGVVEVIGEGTAVITAKVPNDNATYAPTSAAFTITVSNVAADKYNLTSVGETFEDGDLIIIGAAGKINFISNNKSTTDDRIVLTLSEAAGSTIIPTESDEYMIFKLEKVEGGFRLKTTNYAGTDGYVTSLTDGNSFQINTTATDNSIFTITYDTGNDAVIKCLGNSLWLRYNAGKFRFYSSNLGKAIVIYKKAKATKPSTPEFSMPSGSVLTWKTAGVTITSANATKVCYRLSAKDSNGETQYTEWKSVDGNHAVVYIAFNCTIEAYGQNIYGESDLAEATYTVTGSSATIYNYVYSLEQIDLFKKYILVNRDNNVAMGTYNASGKYHTLAEIGVSTDGNSVTSQNALKFMFVKVDNNNDDPFGGGTTGGDDPSEPASAPARETAQSSYTYYMMLENGNYMKLSTTANQTSEVESTSEATKFTIEFPDGNLVLLSDSESNKYLGCNFGSKRFSSYSDNQYKTTYLYREGETLTEVADILDEAESAEVEWYTLDGVRVKNPAPGIYIRRCGSKVGKYIIK